MTAKQAIDIIKCLAWHKRPSEEEIEDAIKALEQTDGLLDYVNQSIEAEKKAKSEHELEETVDAKVDFFQDNRKNIDVVKPILQEVKALGYDKPQSISDLNDAKKILAMCK